MDVFSYIIGRPGTTPNARPVTEQSDQLTGSGAAGSGKKPEVAGAPYGVAYAVNRVRQLAFWR